MKKKWGVLFMILELPPTRKPTLPRKLPWKQEIRRNIYIRNQNCLQTRLKTKAKDE